MKTVGLSDALGRQEVARQPAASPGNTVPADGLGPMPLRGASYTLIVLPLAELARPDFFGRLRAKIGQAPSFFEFAPVLVDLSGTSGGETADFAELAAQLGRLSLIPVGVRGGGEDQISAAARAGLAAFPDFRQSGGGSRETGDAAQAQSSARAAAARRTMLIDRPVRSGARIYAEGADLVVLAPVSAGAEVLADGCIHVYAPLRGRALAGISGDTGARIFVRRLEAELVSVAGHYRVSEDFGETALGRPTQIRLRGDTLQIEPMD